MIVHLYFSTLANQSRARREMLAALDANITDRILFVGYQKDDGPVWEHHVEKRPVDFYHAPLAKLKTLPSFLKRGLQFIQWHFRAAGEIVRQSKKQDVQILHCHSLPALPLAIYLRWRLKAPVLYDAHELETERNGWNALIKFPAKLLERLFIDYVDHTIVVSHRICDWYTQNYGDIPITTIRNFPIIKPGNKQSTTESPLRAHLDIPKDDIVFIYVGSLHHGRGLDVILDAFQKQDDPHKHMVFMGYGPYEDAIRHASNHHKTIHFKDAVAPGDVLTWTAGADIGIALIEDSCLSYRYCLPNKLFEYVHSGQPVIASNLPEMREMIEDYHLGWTTDLGTDALLNHINAIDGKTLEKQQKSIKKNAKHLKDLTWDSEKATFLNICRLLIKGRE